MNDFPLIGNPCYAYRILGSPAGEAKFALYISVVSKKKHEAPSFSSALFSKQPASFSSFECFVFETTEKYSTNLAINVGGLAHLSFLFLITCGDIYNECNYAPPGGGGTPYRKGVRMLVVSLRGVNFGFWCHVGCSG